MQHTCRIQKEVVQPRFVNVYESFSFRYILKADDDTFVNVVRLLHVLDGMPNNVTTRLYMGYVQHQSDMKCG